MKQGKREIDMERRVRERMVKRRERKNNEKVRTKVNQLESYQYKKEEYGVNKNQTARKIILAIS